MVDAYLSLIDMLARIWGIAAGKQHCSAMFKE